MGAELGKECRDYLIAIVQRCSLLSSSLTALLPLVIPNECMTVAFYSTFSIATEVVYLNAR